MKSAILFFDGIATSAGIITSLAATRFEAWFVVGLGGFLALVAFVNLIALTDPEP